MTERPPRAPKPPYQTEAERVAAFKAKWNAENPKDRLEPNEVSLKVPTNGTRSQMSWEERATPGVFGAGEKVGVNAPYLDLGEPVHAQIYQDWAHQTGQTPDNWSTLVARHGSDKDALPHSLWGGTVKVRSKETGKEYTKPLISNIDKLTWQNSATGTKLTHEARQRAKAQQEEFAANPENKEVVQEREYNDAARTKKRLQSVGLTGDSTLNRSGQFKEKTQAAVDKVAGGEVPSRVKLEPENIPGYTGTAGERHAIGTEDPRPDISVGRQQSPAAARFFGVSDDFSHHNDLTKAVTDLVTRSKGGDEGAAAAGIKNASGQLSFHQPTTSVTIASPAEHHANLALQYLAASAKAHSLGMKDIAVNNFANATEHAKHLESYVGGKPAAAPAGGGLAALLAGGAAPTSHTDLGVHLQRYKAAMGVK